VIAFIEINKFIYREVGFEIYLFIGQVNGMDKWTFYSICLLGK